MSRLSREALFIGNYFSHLRGTQPVMERVAIKLRADGIKISLSSKKIFWLWRVIDHFKYIFFKSYSIAFVDVFSDRSFMLAEWAVFWLRIRKKKIVLTLRGGKLSEFDARQKERVNKLFRKADQIQTPSLFLQNYFKEEIEISYLPNPIDIELFSFVKKGSPSTCKLLWVRAFTEIYNPHVAVLVLQKVLLEFPEATLTMVGPDKGLMNKTIDLIKELNLVEKINIVGPVSNDKLSSYYQSHDVYLNTTSYESFGVAVVEAASCGIPIVSFNVGEIPFLWNDRENILLADFGDVDGMADAVNAILADSSLVEKLSRNAREKAEVFQWNNIRPEWIKLLGDE